MSEYINTDIGEFLTNKTGNFEKSPPDELWNKIENNIPTYSGIITNKTLIKYLIGGISLSAVIIFLLIHFQPFSSVKNSSSTVITENKTQVKNTVALTANDQILTKPSNIENTAIVSENKKAEKTITSSEENTKKETIVKSNNSVTYSINASSWKNVTTIAFINDKNETVLITKNPTPNSFGFYIIDISQLAKGTYNIMITTPEGVKLHKRETF